MARKTKSELLAEQAELKASWFSRLMAVMKESNSISVTENNEFDIELWVDDERIQGEFPYELPLDIDQQSSLNWRLERFEDEIQMRNRRIQEEIKNRALRSQALAKLTDEEKIALGIK